MPQRDSRRLAGIGRRETSHVLLSVKPRLSGRSARLVTPCETGLARTGSWRASRFRAPCARLVPFDAGSKFENRFAQFTVFSIADEKIWAVPLSTRSLDGWE